MAEQENGRVKKFKVRRPMEVYVQICKDAKAHNTKPATHARHLLCDAMMDVDLDEADFETVRKLVEKNWVTIRNRESKKG